MSIKESKPEILIIGAAILDVLVRPASADVFRTGSYPAEEIRMSMGGDALNEATILARMGKKVQLETIIGMDDAGKYIQNHCREQGIQIDERCVKKNQTTGINVVLVSEDGSRSFLTNPHGTLRSLTVDDIHMPVAESVKVVCFASIFVFPQIGAAELCRIFSQVKAQGKILCADMTKKKKQETVEEMAEALSYLDYLFANDEEAMLLTGEDTVEKAADKLKATGVGNVVIKCGKQGCYYQTDVEKRWVPAVQGVNCIDTTGAGDSFAAGFIHALAEGRDIRACAEYGNECGAKAVEVVGATEWIAGQ